MIFPLPQPPAPSPPPTLESRGVIYLGGMITEGTSRDICTRIIQANFEETQKRLLLVINTPGGSLSDTFAICDVMAWSRIPVHTLGLGMVQSGGFLIMMAGARGHRTVTPNTSILSHQFSNMVCGTKSALVAARHEDDFMHARMLAHYKKYTKLKTDKAVETALLKPVDVWLSARAAVRYGVVDRVSDGHDL